MKLIPVLLCLLLTACTRAEGAISPPKLITEEIDLNQIQTSDKSLLPQVEPEALEPVFNYVMALNLALTGDLSGLKQSADATCAYEESESELAQNALDRALADCPNYPLALLLRRVFCAGWPSSSFAMMRGELHPRICHTLFGSSI